MLIVIKSHKQLVSSLTFRLLLPIVFLMILLGLSLSLFIREFISEFVDKSIKDNLEWASHTVYSISDKSLDELLQTGTMEDRIAVKIKQGLTLATIEELIRQNRFEIIIYSEERQKVIYASEILDQPMAIIENLSEEKEVVLLKYGTEKYYTYHFQFPPWKWRIVLLKNAVIFSDLISKVDRSALVVTGGVVFITVLFLIYYLDGYLKREKAEKALQESEQNYRLLVENMNDSLAVLDTEGRVTYANPQMMVMTGYSHEEIIGLELLHFFDETNQSIFKKQIAKRKEGGHDSYEIEFTRKDGGRVPTIISPQPLFDKGGNYKGSFGVVIDITERKQVEEKINKLNQELEERVNKRTVALQQSLDSLRRTQNQLIIQEKLASLGTMTAGISHELKNPLNLVNNFAEQCAILTRELQEELKTSREGLDGQKTDKLLTMIEKAALATEKHGKRANNIIQAMVLHAHKRDQEWQSVDINQLFKQYTNLAFHSMRATDNTFNVNLESDLDDSLEPIRVIPPDIGRVFLNILNNALYATRHKSQEQTMGFVPTVRTQTKNLENQIEIRIWDNGTGISKKDIDKIFEPFFTTKPAGSGTGLGLYLSYEIVTQEHQGSFHVNSKEGEYTEFILILPKHVESDSA